MVAQNEKEATFGLLYNGLDFLVSALGHLRGSPSARDMKYGVLHLSAGVALLLKEPLRRRDPKLVFENPDMFDQTAYEEGNFRSVGVEKCIARLKGIGIEVPLPARAALKVLKPDRNRLEHFGARIAVAELSAVTASVLSFAVDFVRDHLDPVSGPEAELIEDIREGLLDFTAMVQARQQAIADNLKSATAVRTCARCSEDALILGAGDVHCAFCARKFTAEEAAEEYLGVLGYSRYEAIKDGGSWPLHTCPDCESDALVEEEDGYVCFSCGTETDHFFKCTKCGALYEDEEQGTVCSECFDEAVNSDD